MIDRSENLLFKTVTILFRSSKMVLATLNAPWSKSKKTISVFCLEGKKKNFGNQMTNILALKWFQ